MSLSRVLRAAESNPATNTLLQATALAQATGEPYTCTAIGPDGTAYAINDGSINAIFGRWH